MFRQANPRFESNCEYKSGPVDSFRLQFSNDSFCGFNLTYGANKICDIANLLSNGYSHANLATFTDLFCSDSPNSPTFANLFCSDSPHSPTCFARTRQTGRNSPKAIFEKNVPRLAKLARVICETCSHFTSSHCLQFTQIQQILRVFTTINELNPYKSLWYSKHSFCVFDF
jgi:hypothetical protein